MFTLLYSCIRDIAFLRYNMFTKVNELVNLPVYNCKYIVVYICNLIMRICF